MSDEYMIEDDDYFDDEADVMGTIGLSSIIEDDYADITEFGWSDTTEGLDWSDNQSTQGTPHVDLDRMQTAIDALGEARSLIADEAVALVDRLRQWYGAKDHQLDINLAEIERCIILMAQALANPAGLVFQALQQMEFDQQQALLGLLEQALNEFRQKR